MACSPKTKCYSTFGTGVFFILLGIALIVGWPYLHKYIVTSELTLHPKSTGYDMWKETPIPMYLELYLFNWTNVEEVEKDWTIKPHMQEMGPYVFLEHHTKVNVTWNDNNTVTFQQVRRWNFQPDLSGGSLDDNITNLNAVAATIGYLVRHKHYVIQKAVDLLMRDVKEKFYTTRTARELLFEGYNDKILDIIHTVNASGINVPFKKFAWFAERNESATFDGVFTMFTGMDNMKKLGVMDRWNGYSQVPYYPGYCGDVLGTTGELWPPVVGNTSVYMFSSDMCSLECPGFKVFKPDVSSTTTADILKSLLPCVVPQIQGLLLDLQFHPKDATKTDRLVALSTAILDHASHAELHGIEGEHFVGTKRTFDNGQLYPEQSCFNVGEPVATGMRNVSECRFGAPAFLSFPHFYLSDPRYLARIDGLNPNKNDHELYLDIEPTTGLPMNVRARVQINILLQSIPGISMYKNVIDTFVPVLWFTQRVTLTEDYAKMVKFLLVLPNLGMYTGIGLVSIGLLLIFIGLAISCHGRWKGTEGEALITTGSNSSLAT